MKRNSHKKSPERKDAYEKVKVFDDNSMYKRRDVSDNEFSPVATNTVEIQDKKEIADFVPKPLYTKKQLRDFKDKNTHNGVFTTTSETVSSVDDLEKIMFLWQEMTENQSDTDHVSLGNELRSKDGFTFSELIIDENNGGL